MLCLFMEYFVVAERIFIHGDISGRYGFVDECAEIPQMLGCSVGGSSSLLQPHIKFFDKGVSQIIPAISWPVLGQCLYSGEQIALCATGSVGCPDDVPAEGFKGDIGRTLRAECFPDERECRGYSPLPEPQFNSLQPDDIFINHCIQSFRIGVIDDALAPFIPLPWGDIYVT